MSTPLDNKINDPALIQAKQCLQELNLDKALTAIEMSLKKRQQDSGSDLSFYGTLLWCDILLTKGRFSKDSTFPTLAKYKLVELEALIPQLKNSVAFLQPHLLMGEMYLQLGENLKAKTVYQDILQMCQKEAHDIGEIQALNGLTKLALTNGQIEEALELANQSLELLIQHTDEAHYWVLVANYLLQSQIFIHKKDLSQAKNYAERALQICEIQNMPEQAIEAHLLLGQITVTLKENATAITHLLIAKEQSLRGNHQSFLASTILYIGVVYYQVFHYPKALENLNTVVANYQALLTVNQQVLLLNYLGTAQLLSYQDEIAINHFLAAEKLAKKHRNKPALVFCLAFLGVAYSRREEYNKALRYAKRVNTLIQEIGDVNGVQVNLINLGNVHSKLEKYSESIKLTSRGIAAAKRMKDGLSEIRGYQIMAEIFRKQKAFKSAVMYQMIYTKFYEDFYQRNDRQKVLEIEHQFIVKQLEERIKKLESMDKA
ncbi:MAG: tetratricopeptide repeat protein [Saprospiraceae bacterium]